jgi:drug/metabolite transporter (DMT)-like permease
LNVNYPITQLLQPMRPSLPILAAAATGILVGAAIVVTRFVIAQTEPASLAFLRYLLGCVCLLPPWLMAEKRPFAPREWLPLGLLGIVQFGAVVGLLNYALQTVPSARAALIFATSPLLTLLLAAVFGQEPITWPKATGVLLTIVGVGLALGERLVVEDGSGQNWWGETAVFISAFCAALCSVLYRPYLRKYPPLQISLYAMFASVLFLAVLAAGEGFFQGWPQFTEGGWLAVGFIGLNSGVGYYLWLWALRHTTATNVTIFLALNPITAATLGVLFLGEGISIPFLWGLGCVIVGLWLSLKVKAQLGGKDVGFT